MKRVLFLTAAIAVMFSMVLVSCGDSKKSNAAPTEAQSQSSNGSDGTENLQFIETMFPDGYVLISAIKDNGDVIHGMKKDGKIIIKPEYTSIVMDSDNGVFLCQTNRDPVKKIYTVTDMTGKVLLPGEYYKATRDENGDYHLFTLTNEEKIYSPKK
ncbi:MAG: hypothetical protein Q4D80_03490 [Pseudomonadota bacterium]|nr:hypothetical protein [Pseudomonadota bacterium]